MNRNINSGENLVVCLSHDVDRIKKTIQYVTHFIKAIKKRNINLALYHLKSISIKNHYWCFEKIMNIENKYGVKSTFFFLKESHPINFLNLESYRLSVGYYDLFNPRIIDIINKLDTSGWEIGLHGSYLSYRDVELLKKEKIALESIVGHKVAGVRQHYLNLDDYTWKKQIEAGFLYDASFGFKDDVGFKDERYIEFQPFPDKSFKVVPLAIMDSCIMSLPNPYEKALELINIALQKNAILVLNWHQRVFNEIEFPKYKALYIFIIEKCMHKKAKFLTIEQLVNWNR